ncbi:hypothetical protein KKA24_01770 [Patescibacteria group bacterium]|nr:hypothetical protein [Patescibacteria group bacterium]
MKKLIIALIILIIAVGGFFAYQQLTQEKTPEEENQEPIDETADWQVYKSEQGGYEIKYPEGWFLKNKSEINIGGWGDDVLDKISIENKKDIMVINTAAYIPDGQGFLYILVEKTNVSSIGEYRVQNGLKQTESKNIKIGETNVNAVVSSEEGDNIIFNKTIQFVYNGKIYYISYEQYLGKTGYENLERILSTFKFID